MNKKYICEPCGFSSDRKTEFTRHRNTKKHFRLTGETSETSANYESDNEQKHICAFCNGVFSTSSNKNRHMSKCTAKQTSDEISMLRQQLKQQQDNLENRDSELERLRNECKALQKENKEIQNEYNEFVKESFRKAIDKVGNRTTNNTNMYTAAYIINTYPDAPNIDESLNNSEIDEAFLEQCQRLGYIEGGAELINKVCIDGIPAEERTF